MYSGVFRLFSQYLLERSSVSTELTSFTFTSINVNSGYAAKIHRDSNNVGLSVAKAFGDYVGGRLRTWEDDRRKSLEDFDRAASRSYDIGPGSEGGLLLFDGHDAHEVEDFEGERFSLVYFTAARAAHCPPRDLAKLRELLPTVQAAANAAAPKAAAPKAAAQKAAAPKAVAPEHHAPSDLPMHWPNAALAAALSAALVVAR
jgi:hypothetical protein